MSRNKKIESVGPFGDAMRNVESIARNFYMNSLYAQSIEQLQEAQAAYECAVLEGDAEQIEKKRSELLFVEELIKLTSIGFNAVSDEYNPPAHVTE